MTKRKKPKLKDTGNVTLQIVGWRELATLHSGGEFYKPFMKGYRHAKLGKPMETTIPFLSVALAYERGRQHFHTGRKPNFQGIYESFTSGDIR